MVIRVLVCALMGIARLVEVRYSTSNLRRTGSKPDAPANQAAYPFIVALHAATFVVTALAGGKPRWLWLALLLVVQPLRIWVLWTLGERWNVRGAVPRDVEIETDGPYRYVRHPNYTVVAVELAVLPLAFGLRSVALAASLANAILLTIRVRDEERALFDEPAYREHFERLPRFLPFLF